MKNTVEHHFEEEESEIFELGESRMPAAQLRDIGQELQERKKEIKIRLAA